jgi:hypothetical protein
MWELGDTVKANQSVFAEKLIALPKEHIVLQNVSKMRHGTKEKNDLLIPENAIQVREPRKDF